MRIRLYGAAPGGLLAERHGPALSEGKRLSDFAIAAIGLVCLAPLIVVIAAAVRLSSPGPILYRQQRSGLNGQKFKIYKFRTLYEHACDREDAPHCRQVEWDDDRVTPLGRLLRRTSFDELPQLLNVLQGDMSIVGPRPHAIPHDLYYSQFISEYSRRYTVKPGLTGLAQVKGYRGETKSLEQMQLRVEADLTYIDNWSLRVDLVIIWKTLFILGDADAY
jgi:putative colanic acid biosynthesis UDP-glucose lipid carrier transferase